MIKTLFARLQAPLAAGIAIVLCLTGCTTGMSKIVRELKNDPATVHLRVTSIYGTVTFTRTAPGTNSVSHTINPDGTVSVGK